MAAAAGLILPGDGIIIAGKIYSGVALTLENCLLPPERVHCSPSRAHGLSARTEEQLRNRMCEMIQNAGILLRLPQSIKSVPESLSSVVGRAARANFAALAGGGVNVQVAMATAQILFHRFFYCKSFVRHCAETVAMACLQLASKIEEEPRRARDILNVFHRLKHAAGNRPFCPLLLDDGYVSRKGQVIKAERRVLKELGFCVHVKHPHKVIMVYLQVLECEKNTRLLQIAWNYMNDSLRTDVFLRFSAETVACACIFLSARVLQIPLPEQPPWFLLFGVSEEDLIEISCCILRLYTLRCDSLTALQQQVEETRLKLASKPGGKAFSTHTPTREPAAGFSPSSKPATPEENQKNQESPLSHLALKNACRKITSRECRKRLSRSDERRNTRWIPSPPRRRRSRSVSSPSLSVSPEHTHSYRHRQRERERERTNRSSRRR